MDDEKYASYCASMGVRVMKSSIDNAGLGLWLIAPRFIGDANSTSLDRPTLKVPYFGTYNVLAEGDRSIILQDQDRNVAHELVLNGDARCPATYANDPMVRARRVLTAFAFAFSLPSITVRRS